MVVAEVVDEEEVAAAAEVEEAEEEVAVVVEAEEADEVEEVVEDDNPFDIPFWPVRLADYIIPRCIHS